MIYLFGIISLIADIVWIVYEDDPAISLNAQAVAFFTLFLTCMVPVFRRK